MLTVVVPMLILLGLCPGSARSGALPVGPGTDPDPYGELLTRIERLEQRDRQQSEHIAALESNMATMAAVITDQQREIDDLKSKALDKPEPETEQEDTSNAKNTDSDKVRVSESGDERAAVPESSIRAARGHEGKRQLTRSVSDGKVAFFATRNANLLHLGSKQNIDFEGSVVNVGNAYNPHHGVFTAPVSGTYLFSVSIMAYNNKEVWTQLTLNGHVVSHIYARGTDNRHDQGSQTVILTLKQGDDVTVQNQASDDAIWGEGYSSFTGLLLWSTQSEAVIVG